jgi:hypothetical protein
MRQVCTTEKLGVVRPEDVVVSKAMIEVGLSVLEETDDRPLSRATVERAFQEMCLCAVREAVRENTDRK